MFVPGTILCNSGDKGNIPAGHRYVLLRLKTPEARRPDGTEQHAGVSAEADRSDCHYLQTTFYPLHHPSMPYVSLPDFEIKDGSMAIAMSSPHPILSRAIPLLTFIQSTVD